MAYDEALAERIRDAIGARARVTEKEMFGGLAFLLDGKMFCGIVKDDLMARVGPEGFDETLTEDHVRPMDFAGRPMKGYVYVDPGGTSTRQEVARWVERSMAHVATLPEKRAKKPKAKPKAKKARSR